MCFEEFNKDQNYTIVKLQFVRINFLIDQRRHMDKFLKEFILSDGNGLFKDEFKEKYKEIMQDKANKLKAPYWDDTFKKQE